MNLNIKMLRLIDLQAKKLATSFDKFVLKKLLVAHKNILHTD